MFATNLRNGVEAQCSNNEAIVETNNTYSCALHCASSGVSCIAESNEYERAIVQKIKTNNQSKLKDVGGTSGIEFHIFR